jgi:organic hydroperoxide reductase OsmC/OhrA
MEIKPLFTATATATGGRNGHTAAEDGSVSVDLSVPKAMGGPGRPGTSTPEHLFAAGYAACFGGALDYVASQRKQNAKGGISDLQRHDRPTYRRRIWSCGETSRGGPQYSAE